MSKYQVAFSGRAYDDVRDIYTYIAFSLNNPQAAKNTADRLLTELRKLDAFPKRHETVDWEPWNAMGLQKFPIGNYLAFYLVNEELKTVYITRILYGGQDLTSIDLS